MIKLTPSERIQQLMDNMKVHTEEGETITEFTNVAKVFTAIIQYLDEKEKETT